MSNDASSVVLSCIEDLIITKDTQSSDPHTVTVRNHSVSRDVMDSQSCSGVSNNSSASIKKSSSQTNVDLRTGSIPGKFLGIYENIINPFTTVAVHFLAWSILIALHSDINQTASWGDNLSTWENRCMHAGQPGQRRPHGKIGSVQRSILVGQIWPNGPERVNICFYCDIVLMLIYYF